MACDALKRKSYRRGAHGHTASGLSLFPRYANLQEILTVKRGLVIMDGLFPLRALVGVGVQQSRSRDALLVVLKGQVQPSQGSVCKMLRGVCTVKGWWSLGSW